MTPAMPQTAATRTNGHTRTNHPIQPGGPNRPTRAALLALGLCVALVGGCSDKPKDTHPQQWVTKRQAVFKEMTKTFEPMGLMARERKPFEKGEFLTLALALQELAAKPWPLFPADSNYPPTRAKPALWLQPQAWEKAVDDYRGKVTQLVSVSNGADMAALKDAVNAVEKSCKSCHDEFRNER